MENTYLTALHGMEELLPTKEGALGSFNKRSYPGTFRAYYEARIEVYQALEDGYNTAIDKQQYLFNMAEAVVNSAEAVMAEISQKRKKEARLLDLNLNLVTYVIPAILEFGGESAKPLTEEILRQWKETYPKTNLTAASYETIESGFHRKWCYITTAVCETLGKPDDCYELTVLRGYRDGYLMSCPDGEELIRRYYDVAPTIVKRINRLPDRREIYREVWDSYLSPCIALIENGENEACKELYIKMVEELQEAYFYGDQAQQRAAG